MPLSISLQATPLASGLQRRPPSAGKGTTPHHWLRVDTRIARSTGGGSATTARLDFDLSFPQLSPFSPCCTMKLPWIKPAPIPNGENVPLSRDVNANVISSTLFSWVTPVLKV